MGLGQIGQNATNEFFEDLVYSVAYNEVISQISKVVDVDNEYINDALNSSINIITSGALFLYMQKQEEFIEKVCSIVYKAVGFYVLNPLKSSITNKIRNKTGRKLINFLKFITSSENDNTNKARLAVELGSFNGHSDKSSYGKTSVFSDYYTFKNNKVATDEHKLNYAKAKVDSINQQTLLKILTKRLTENDKDMIKKITGSPVVDIEAMNKIADFLYITDEKGQIQGLSEQFFRMINGLGYTYGKRS